MSLTAGNTAQTLPMSISQTLNEKHYRSLNGLRGISIVLVVMDHLRFSSTGIYATIFNGALGVNIFFVISGFLITTLCLKEQSLTGKIDLKKFYIRRILRIFPVAYLYIAVIFIMDHIFKLQVAGIQLIGGLFYLMDLSYFRRNNFSWFVGHYWSLSVEEQFYIIFPFILKKSRRIFTFCVVGLVVVLPVLCTLQEFIQPLNQGFIYGFTHYFIKFQAISVGCLLSILAFKGFFDQDWLRSTKLVGNIIAFLLIFYLKFEEFYTIKAVWINLLISIITAYIIITNLKESKDVIFRVLNFKPLALIGILSYSIYIWQQIFTSNNEALPQWFIKPPYNLVLIIVVPCLSYFFYERYFLKLKSKFSQLRLQKNEEAAAHS